VKIFPTVERTEDLDAVDVTEERELERLSPGMLIEGMEEMEETRLLSVREWR